MLSLFKSLWLRRTLTIFSSLFEQIALSQDESETSEIKQMATKYLTRNAQNVEEKEKEKKVN